MIHSGTHSSRLMIDAGRATPLVRKFGSRTHRRLAWRQDYFQIRAWKPRVFLQKNACPSCSKFVALQCCPQVQRLHPCPGRRLACAQSHQSLVLLCLFGSYTLRIMDAPSVTIVPGDHCFFEAWIAMNIRVAMESVAVNAATHRILSSLTATFRERCSNSFSSSLSRS